MSGFDWENLRAEACLPATRAKSHELIEAITRLRDARSNALSAGQEQLRLAQAQRRELDLAIEKLSRWIADLQEPFDPWQTDLDRLEAILRETAGGMN